MTANAPRPLVTRSWARVHHDASAIANPRALSMSSNVARPPHRRATSCAVAPAGAPAMGKRRLERYSTYELRRTRSRVVTRPRPIARAIGRMTYECDGVTGGVGADGWGADGAVGAAPRPAARCRRFDDRLRRA